MKHAPGTLIYGLYAVCPPHVVTLVIPVNAPATFQRDDEKRAHTARSRRYPEIITEIKTRYGANALGPCYLSPFAT